MGPKKKTIVGHLVFNPLYVLWCFTQQNVRDTGTYISNNQMCLVPYLNIIRVFTAVDTVRSGVTRPVRIRDPRSDPGLSDTISWKYTVYTESFIEKVRIQHWLLVLE
jgi:hypothetical protein